ncbi:hypothetical protein [Bacillus atrophaeus]|uniref:hypothetical protein n=1 Tax=Bacillus atrophaeus TaxID=1452 RepID=UPI00228036AF|nr:hypothetical protein [Bacillus atrophaeus]MCY8466992.1 hypothetical protein [Bacillus atrophaeus]MCY8475667.1 hypothetical protein [Bacillus atrophaeus]MCY9166549.1 hypothetical protein [Bacillus atrophaeus]
MTEEVKELRCTLAETIAENERFKDALGSIANSDVLFIDVEEGDEDFERAWNICVNEATVALNGVNA